MPRAKRGKFVSHLRSSINMASDPCNKGWLSIRTNTSKQPHQPNEDGTPLIDEILLLIFIGFLDIADLVRCAATCRRWCHLVSSNANFICRTSQQLCFVDKFIPSLIVGFFHKRDDATTLSFIPMALASHRFPIFQKTSLSLAMDIDDGILNSSRIVASRNGLLVIEVQRGKHSRTLNLCVCNPMSGEVHVLPTLRGNDSLGHYACTVLTAVDYQNKNQNNNPRPPSSHYHLLIVYNRLHFTAFRSYSSKDGIWTPEGKVNGTQLGKNQIRLMHNGVIACGGQVAYWITTDLVFGLHLNTLEATMMRLPWPEGNTFIDTENILLGTTPKGRLCAIQFSRHWYLSTHGKWVPTNEICVITYDNNGSTNNSTLQMSNSLWKTKINIQVDQALKVDALATEVKLQWFCEKSGVVFFTASYYGRPRSEVYALNLGTSMIEKVTSNDRDNDSWNNFYGYEMDHASYLASLSEPKVTENM